MKGRNRRSRNKNSLCWKCRGKVLIFQPNFIECSEEKRLKININNQLEKTQKTIKTGRGFVFVAVLFVFGCTTWQGKYEVITTGLPGKSPLLVFCFFFNSGKCDEKSSVYLSMVSESAESQRWWLEVSAPSYWYFTP